MSSLSASALALVLYGASAAPIGLALARPVTRHAVAAAYGAAFLFLSAYQLGWLSPAGWSRYDTRGLPPTDPDQSRCAEVIRILEQAGVVQAGSRTIDTSTALWRQIPEETKKVIAPCFDTKAPSTR